ncbi:MAG TPA: hypothetical protein VFD66_02040, partial [Verrucomicrobiae bacterium]|nr:hypothetical protein [Verrucomicrobiae bacterium]
MIPQYFYGFGRMTGFAASVVFIVAFFFTLWPGRRRLATAAVLYALGLLIGLAFSVYFHIGFAWNVYRMSRMSID